jgi:predicted SprT family Zn-dependent metalloprotease
MGFLYSRNLAKTMAKRQGVKKIDVASQVGEALGVDENGEVDQSVWCGDEDKFEKEESQEVELEKEVVESDDEDEDPVADARNRRRQPPTKQRQFEQDEDSMDEYKDDEEEVTEVKSQRESLQAQPAAPKPTLDMLPGLKGMSPVHRKSEATISNWTQQVIDLTSSPQVPESFVLPPPTRNPYFSTSRPTSSYSNDGAAILQYSPTPTKLRSPRKAPPISRPSTPPLPPASPSKLVSPSKKKNRIPTAPGLRPSLDAFWSADVVNDWNQKHSPTKPLISPRKQKWLKEIGELIDSSDDSDASFHSPSASPAKKKVITSSPAKKALNEASPTVAEARKQRKAFAESKHTIAENFLAEIDRTITEGKIACMAASTGGIKLIWSKTLKTTAGRANWRREQLRLRMGPDPTNIKVEYRHHCSIELAEKVIDDEERLYNVLAHEYCHLTTFMISEVRNNPHGAEFKSWAAKVSKAFAHKGVEVTTKHSYQIAYKYVWECITCGYEFKRHSKSVDPSRHSCGRCKGKLVQTKPTPRGGAKAGGKEASKSEYQLFVKANFSTVKKRLEAEGKDTQMGKVMAAVAEQYKAEKERKESEKEKGVVEVEELFESLKIQDEDV